MNTDLNSDLLEILSAIENAKARTVRALDYETIPQGSRGYFLALLDHADDRICRLRHNIAKVTGKIKYDIEEEPRKED
jgi:hypothetical protein